MSVAETEIEKIIEEKYNKYTPEEQQKVHSLYHKYSQNPEKFAEDLKKVEKIIFKKRPPTGAEFLDYRTGWLPKKVIDSLYPHVKEDFLDIIDGKKNYFQLVFYGGTRLGKSFLARLLIIYTIIFIHHLRSPALFYGLSPLTSLALYFISFKFDKTKQLYLAPIYKYLEASERFIKEKFQDKVILKQKQYGCDKIVWSKAAESGEITLASGLQILLGNDNPNEIIGADILQCYISEIAYFIDEAGASEEDIFTLYTNAYDRISATVGKGEYLTWILLDSSANYADSQIEQHIIKKLQFSPDTFFRWRSRWNARPYRFPIWYRGLKKLQEKGVPSDDINETLYKEGLVFKVITGNGSIPACIVSNELQLKDVPPDLIDYVPIDVKEEYDQNPIKSIKDVGGKPTSNESKYIQNHKVLDMLFDNPTLLNIEGGVEADAKDQPEGLIWNKIHEKFFKRTLDGRYIIYRAPNEPRVLAIDTAHSASGDIYGISLCHLERSIVLHENICVADFIFVFTPGKEGINLTAIQNFIEDLCYKGNISLLQVNSDSFQSAQTLQNLKRNDIDIERQSVDKSLEPYIRLYTGLVTGTVKAGRNIFLKNNLKCLERVRNDKGKEKFDHPKGPTNNKYLGDWENAKNGTYAKDASDCLASASFTLFEARIIPNTIYEDENKRLQNNNTVMNEEMEVTLKKAYLMINNTVN